MCVCVRVCHTAYITAQPQLAILEPRRGLDGVWQIRRLQALRDLGVRNVQRLVWGVHARIHCRTRTAPPGRPYAIALDDDKLSVPALGCAYWGA